MLLAKLSSHYMLAVVVPVQAVLCLKDT